MNISDRLIMRRLLLPTVIILLIGVSCTSGKPQETESGSFLYNKEPMPMDTASSLQYKWDNKEILSSIRLDGMESLDNWELSFGNRDNAGTISLSGEKVIEGNSSIKFVCPTKLPEPLGADGRYWGRQNLTRKFDLEDFSEYNRIAINVYPEFNGFR